MVLLEKLYIVFIWLLKLMKDNFKNEVIYVLVI